MKKENSNSEKIRETTEKALARHMEDTVNDFVEALVENNVTAPRAILNSTESFATRMDSHVVSTFESLDTQEGKDRLTAICRQVKKEESEGAEWTKCSDIRFRAILKEERIKNRAQN